MKADLWTIAIATGTVAFVLSGVVVALLGDRWFGEDK